MPARAIGVILVGLLAAPAGADTAAPPAPPDGGGPRDSCREATAHRQCLRRCTPARLILLPCMAVGAKAMAACREREVAGCVETCRRKFC